MAATPKEKQKIQSFDTHELVPFACHINAQSLVTKNVELVQVIKLERSGGADDDTFRNSIRAALNKHVDPSKIAVWVYTTRTKKQIVESGNENFTNHIDALWKQALPDELRYINNVYISLVIDFNKFPLWQPHNYLRSLHNKAEERRFNGIIEENHQELTSIADKIIDELNNFGARRLEIVKRDGVYYSEPMEFFHKLLTFSDAPVPVKLGDISRYLYPEKFNFNLYSGQVAIDDGEKNSYGSVITLKESILLDASALKEILNTGYELIISEAIDFSFGNKKLPEYQYQKYVNSLTEDKRFVEIMGGSNDEPVAENFALHQLSILIIRNNLKDFNLSINDLSQKLKDLGIVCYIEDIYLERSFWAMLAANFAFLKRQTLVSHEEVAMFASLGTDKFTAIEDCMFGEPVTFFENHNGGAFALHFLNDGMSNILITGNDAERKQLLANLIVAQASRFPLNILFYDESKKYKNFADSLNAEYFDKLDLEAIKTKIQNKSVIVINSLKQWLALSDHDAIFDFLDYAASKNATIICLADYADNAEALLPNFRTQIFLTGDVDNYPDHFDLFEDEIKIIDLLEADNFYFKHGYDELVLNFRSTEKLTQALLNGGSK